MVYNRYAVRASCAEKLCVGEGRRGGGGLVKGGRGGLPFHFSSVDENKGKRKKKREVGGRGSEWVGNGGNNKQW